MVNFVNEKGDEVRVPEWVQDLDAFRRWVEAEDFPEAGQVWYYRGEVWVDMSREQLFTHGAVKNDMAFTLIGLAKALTTGRVWTDGVLLTNDDADLGCMPDLLYVSHETFRAERVRLIEGMDEGYVEIEGSPDMTLEIVSRSSVRKDRGLLRQAYWEAGVLRILDRGRSARTAVVRHPALHLESLRGDAEAGRLGQVGGVRQIVPADAGDGRPGASGIHPGSAVTFKGTRTATVSSRHTASRCRR
jgi:hypothetical protein